MLYVYCGDNKEARAKVMATINSLLTKNPDALSLHITSENFKEFSLPELVVAQALFKNEYIVFLDNLLEEGEAKELVLEFIKEIGESTNIFFLLEEKVDTKTLKKLDKHAQKVQKFKMSKTAPQGVHSSRSFKYSEKFNTFALADALGEGNKKKLWQLFWAAKHSGVSDEEIQGVFFWMAKIMFLTSRAKGVAESGLRPFVFNKAKRFANKKSEKELLNTFNTLVKLPHKSRRTRTPLVIGLEQFILRC